MILSDLLTFCPHRGLVFKNAVKTGTFWNIIMIKNGYSINFCYGLKGSYYAFSLFEF